MLQIGKGKQRFPDMTCTHNVPHTAPLGIIIEDVALGGTDVGVA